MAKFEIAEAITGINEGGYANNPADRGGETEAGIARNFWPKWEGWKYIDRYKADYAKAKAQGKTRLSLAQWVNASVKAPSEPVRGLIVEFYKDNFWDINKLDQINDQQLANSVYDFGVNSGTGRAAKFLQIVAGVEQDGKVGSITIAAINEMEAAQAHEYYNVLRESFYRSIAKGNQAQFLKTWLRRLKPYRAV